MKNISLFTALCGMCALLFLSASCEKEPSAVSEETNAENLETITLTVGLPTKINSYSSDPTQILWNSSSENLGVIAKLGETVKYYKFTHPDTKDTGPSSTAEFSGSVDAGATLLYAVFPYSSYNTDNSWDGTSAAIPFVMNDSQACGAAMGITGNALLVSKISGTTVSLHHVCGYLKLKIPARFNRWSKADGSSTKTSTDLTQVLITSSSALAGKVNVTFNADGTIASVDKTSAEKDTLKCATKKNSADVYYSNGANRGSKDTEGAWTPGTMFIPILPGTYSDLKFTLTYRTDINGNTVDAYTIASSGSNTFSSGEAIGEDDGVILSGPFVESLSMETVAKSSSTLNLEGTATPWTYSGVTLSNYDFDFYYREAGSDGAWTSVDASYSNGVVTAAPTVDESKYYEAKLVIVAAGVTYESETETETVTSSVTFDFAGGSYGSFAYYTDGAESGYHKFVNSNGEDIFPNHSVKSTDVSKYYIKEWDGSAFGDQKAPDTFAKTLGMTLTKNGYQAVIEHCAGYYPVYNNVWCPKGVYVKLVCPTNGKITRVLAEVDGGSSERGMTAGIGNKKGDTSIVGSKTVTSPANGENKSIDMVISSATENTNYWLYINNRCSRFTIYYEQPAN